MKITVNDVAKAEVSEALRFHAARLYQRYRLVRDDLRAVERFADACPDDPAARRMLDRVKAEHDGQRAVLRELLIIVGDLNGESTRGLWLETMVANLGICAQ